MIEEETREQQFETFKLPETLDMHKKYEAKVEKPEKEGWPKPEVQILRNNPDGTQDVVYEYQRGYEFYRTFEPFQQLHNGEWKEYALISSEYTRFEVVDLQKGEVIAQEPYPTVTAETHERWRKMGHEDWCEKTPIGTEKPEWGFCPTEFYVPSLFEQLKDWLDSDTEPTYENLTRIIHQGFQIKENEFHHYFPEKQLNLFTGQYAFYSGCVWGDDSSWKLNWIDLSKISEGVVTSDQSRYGYVPLMYQEGQTLKDIVNVSDDGYFTVPLMLQGRVNSAGFWKEGVAWKTDN